MKLDEARHGLRLARERVLAGDVETAVDQIDQVPEEIAPQRLLATAEAAALLGVRSETIISIWCRTGFLNRVTPESDPLIPATEVERMMDSSLVRSIRRSDHLHDASAELGSEEGLDDEELRELAESRPGRLP